MDEGDRDRTLAHRRRHTFDIAAANVTDREHSRQTRFEKMGRPGKRPLGGGQILRGQIRTRLDESFGIERNASLDPFRPGTAPVIRKTCLMSWVSVLPR